MINVYEIAAAMIRARLAGRRRDFVERCVTLADWILRTHGPHGFREFPLDRRALGGGAEAYDPDQPEGRSKSFQIDGKPRLTSSQIRTAREALIQIGVIVKTELKRRQNAWRYYADAFVIGMEFAMLFSETKKTAPQAHNVDGVRSTLMRNSPRNIRIQNRTPLVRATSQNPIPKPFWRRPKPKSEADLQQALAEAHLETLLATMPKKPIELSAEALRSALDPMRYRYG